MGGKTLQMRKNKEGGKRKKKASQAGCFGGREPSSPCFGLELWGTEKDSGDHSQRGCRDAAVPPRRPAASFPPPPTGAAPPRGGQPSPDAPFSNLLRCGGPGVGEKRAPSPSTCQTRPVRSAPSLRPLPSCAGPRGGTAASRGPPLSSLSRVVHPEEAQTQRPESRLGPRALAAPGKAAAPGDPHPSRPFRPLSPSPPPPQAL